MVVMITSKTNTTGEVRMPHRNWTKSFSVQANQVTIVHLPTSAETAGSESVSSNGIEVVSNRDISIYIHQYAGFRSEAAAVLPTSSLGKSYYILTYQGIERRGTIYPSELILVGAYDETAVEITLSANTARGKRKGETMKINLNAGETYQIQGKTANDDFTGSLVVGDKDLSVFGGAVWTEVPTGCNARDNLLEQMYPISTWGKQYLTVPSNKATYDIFRILASEDNTVVSISNGKSYSLAAGEFVEYSIYGKPTFISSTKPILVGQLNIGNMCNGVGIGDPSLLLLNSIEQTRDTVTLYNSGLERIEENYINVVLRTADTSAVLLDGRKIDQSALYQIPGREDYTYASLQVNEGTHTLTSDGCGVLASAYGYGPAESYAYGAGANFSKLNSNPIPVGGCLSDTIFFDTGLSPNRYSFFWDLGNGETRTADKFDYQYGKLGTYDLWLSIYDQCLDIRDTVYQQLEVTLRRGIEVEPDIKLCQGDTIRLGAVDVANATYHWQGPSSFSSFDQFPNFAATLDAAGRYHVVGTYSGCATYPKYAHVEVVPLPDPQLGNDTIVCDLIGDINLDPGLFDFYRWSNGSNQRSVTAVEEGLYWVEVTDDFGCSDTAQILLSERCPSRIYVPNAFSPNGDQVNDALEIFASEVVSLRWRIFDRWGNELYETTDTEDSWDGLVDGDLVDRGVYIWTLEYEGYNEKGARISDVLGGTVTVLY